MNCVNSELPTHTSTRFSFLIFTSFTGTSYCATAKKGERHKYKNRFLQIIFSLLFLVLECFVVRHHVLRFFIKSTFCPGMHGRVGHNGSNGMTVTGFNRRVRLTAAADTFHPIAYVCRR